MSKPAIQMGNGAFISPTEARTKVKGGVFGVDSWVAKVIGLNEEGRLRLNFLLNDVSGLSDSGKSGVVKWAIKSDGVYQWRRFFAGVTDAGWESNGFCIISHGAIRQISAEEAKDLAVEMSM